MISIIIPTYNEAESIARLIVFLKSEGAGEIIVCDGGSQDRTLEIAKAAGATAVLCTKKGRAAQMNVGATIAEGEILYFIHADTLPPAGFMLDIERAVAKGYSLGRYQTRFNSNKPILKFNAFFTRFDWFICFGGDQTLFITNTVFTSINGYNEAMIIMEDYDIVIRARTIGKYKIFEKAALISARKYDTNNWIKVQRANHTIVRMFKSGASQQSMVKKYNEMLTYR